MPLFSCNEARCKIFVTINVEFCNFECLSATSVCGSTSRNCHKAGQWGGQRRGYFTCAATLRTRAEAVSTPSLKCAVVAAVNLPTSAFTLVTLS